jgi:hypothetical protein
MESISQNSAIDKFALDELYESAFGRTIAFRRVFVTITGSVTAALMLSQLWYWKDKGRNPDGWIYKTQKEWLEELGLSRSEQETARRILREKRFIEEKKMGVPCKLHYRVNVTAILDAIVAANDDKEKSNGDKANDGGTEQEVCANPTNLNAESSQTRLQETYELKSWESETKLAHIPQTITESTTENTPKNTQRLLSDVAPPVAQTRSVTSKKKIKPLTERADSICEALIEVCDVEPLLASKKILAQLKTASAAFKSAYEGKCPFEGLALEIKQFKVWWYIRDWRGQNGQAPTPTDVRDKWRSYLRDCNEDPDRIWELVAEHTLLSPNC